MQFVFAYYLIKRLFRAIKVFFILLFRRDLVRQLPSSYLSDMAKTNRWMQAQLAGVAAFALYPLTFLSDALSPLRGVFFLTGLAALAVNLVRQLVSR